jgi:hypothetical protein
LKTAVKLEKVKKEEKTEKSEQEISYASIVRKNLPVVVVQPKTSDQYSVIKLNLSLTRWRIK